MMQLEGPGGKVRNSWLQIHMVSSTWEACAMESMTQSKMHQELYIMYVCTHMCSVHDHEARAIVSTGSRGTS